MAQVLVPVVAGDSPGFSAVSESACLASSRSWFALRWRLLRLWFWRADLAGTSVSVCVAPLIMAGAVRDGPFRGASRSSRWPAQILAGRLHNRRGQPF